MARDNVPRKVSQSTGLYAHQTNKFLFFRSCCNRKCGLTPHFELFNKRHISKERQDELHRIVRKPDTLTICWRSEDGHGVVRDHITLNRQEVCA